MTLLEVCIILPLIFCMVVFAIDRKHERFIKVFSLSGFFIILILSILLLLKFNFLVGGYQYISERNFFESFNFTYILGIDGISLLFVLLVTLLMPICMLCSWVSITYRVKEYCMVLFFLEFVLLNVFSVLDLLLFYIYFEAVLIPMFIIIGIWGSRSRKIHAVYQFFLYTLVGSLVMLVGIMLVYFQTGSTNWFVIVSSGYSELREILIWLSFFCSFSVKVPMIPVHIWLPEAHVEAPTAGSVILAGILLKMGIYGMLRFSLPMFPLGTEYFIPLVYTLSVISIIYASCTTIRQIDLKKVIAYSSVAHMNFVTLGVMSNSVQGIEGSIYLMLGHGFVSSALFLCVGLLYERYGSRVIKYYGSLVYGMPIFGIIFLFFTLANIGFPGLSNFVGEFLILVSVFGVNIFVGLLAMVGVLLGVIYSIWLYNRVMFGVLKKDFLRYYCDLNRREFIYLSVLCILTLIFGIFPGFVLNAVHLNSIFVLY